MPLGKTETRQRFSDLILIEAFSHLIATREEIKMLKALTAEEQRWVDETFASMTEDQMIGQMVNERGNIIRGKKEPVEWLKQYPVGSIFTGAEIIDAFSEGIRVTSGLQRIVEEAAPSIPVVFSGDFENGIGGQITELTRLPRTMGISATFSESDSYDFGKVIGSEAVAVDVRWCVSPVADLNLNRENPVVNTRSTGDEPEHSVRILKSIINGMQDQGCAACAKHFPGDGTDTRNQHYVTSLQLLSKEQWKKSQGMVFQKLIDEGVMSIMVGHIAFPAYEEKDEKSGKWRPATCSKVQMTDLLREEMKFEGVIASDALCMNGYISWADYETRIIDSFNGGVDVFWWPETEKFFALVKAALKDGRISRKRLEESVRRVLEFKARLGLNKKVEKKSTGQDYAELIAENQKIAKRIGEHCITLLRNRAGVLPLKLASGSRILLFIAPDKPTPQQRLQRFADQLRQRGFKVTVAKPKDYELLRSCTEVFDAVIYLCDSNPQYSEHRGFDGILWNFMSDPNIRNRIMISFGTPYFLYDVDEADTYINAYYDCEVCIDAVIKGIFGEIPFAGRSPVRVPYCFDFGDGVNGI